MPRSGCGGAGRSRAPGARRCAMRAFDSADSGARDQGAASTPSSARNVAAGDGEERPGDDEVEAGSPTRDVPKSITWPASVADQEVPDGDVAVQPDRVAVPCGAHRRPRRPLDRVAGHLVAELVDGREGLVARTSPGAAAEEVVLSGRRAVGRVDAAQRVRNPARSRRSAARSSMCACRRELPVEPAVDRPRIREPGVGLPWPPESGSAAKAAGEHGSQRCSLSTCLAYGPARQADGELGSEPEGAVLPAVDVDVGDGELRPLRELAVDEPARQGTSMSTVPSGRPAVAARLPCHRRPDGPRPLTRRRAAGPVAIDHGDAAASSPERAAGPPRRLRGGDGPPGVGDIAAGADGCGPDLHVVAREQADVALEIMAGRPCAARAGREPLAHRADRRVGPQRARTCGVRRPRWSARRPPRAWRVPSAHRTAGLGGRGPRRPARRPAARRRARTACAARSAHAPRRAHRADVEELVGARADAPVGQVREAGVADLRNPASPSTAGIQR